MDKMYFLLVIYFFPINGLRFKKISVNGQNLLKTGDLFFPNKWS